MAFLGFDSLPNPFEEIYNAVTGGVEKFVNKITGVEASQNATDATIEANTAAQAASDAINKPYVDAGYKSLASQEDLMGVNGPEAQAAAIANIQNSAGFQSQLAQGENSILSNASATGGLRGGNTQAAMAQFSPALLGSAIDQRYNQLGGITQMGQASAAGQASSTLDTGQMNGKALAANYMNQYTLPKDMLYDTAGLAIKFAGLM